MSIEGRLNIQMKLRDGGVNRASIESSRPVHAAMVFHGKGTDDTLEMIPLLFNICGAAQACAGVRACEQALGLQVTAQTELLRDAIVNMETLREHLWRILLDWPSFTGAEVDKPGMAGMVSIQRDYRQALCPGGNPLQPGGADCKADTALLNTVLERFAAILQRSVFAVSPAEWLGLTERQGLTAWARARRTIAAELIDQVILAGWSRSGACESRALPQLDGDQLHQAMQNKDFIRLPQWSGHCRETTSLTRVDSLLLQALKHEYGNGLLSRLVARLTEIALLAERLLQNPGSLPAEEIAEFMPMNPGIGQAAAARGQLVHRVLLDDNVIVSYQILAPTEWNFHPQGVAARALSALHGNPVQVEKQARLLINAIDPCVGYDLQIL